MAEYVIAGSAEIGDRYLGRVLPEDRRGRVAEMLPAVRILRMLRWPGQRAIIWPDIIHENDPLPGGCAARLRVFGPASDEERLWLRDFDWAGSLRRCGLIALDAAETQQEKRIIRLQLAGRRTGRRSVAILDEFGQEVDGLRMIPGDSFAEVERRLRNRAKAREEAERLVAEALSDAVSLHGPMAHEGGIAKGMPGDPTGRGADIVLKARERVAEAEAWEAVFRRAERDFPPGSDEHKCASLHYEAGWTLSQIAAMMHYEKQTVRRKRDTFVYRAAWYAAEAGLTRRD